MKIAITIMLVLFSSNTFIFAADASYAVVVSKKTLDDPKWKSVTDALLARHKGVLVVYDDSVNQSLESLTKIFPRHTCFVAKHPEVTRDFVAQVSRLTRKLDEDPYTDTLWGILTGFNADDALRIAKQDQPLVVRKVASGTEVELNLCDEGQWFCELSAGKIVRKNAGESPVVSKGQTDSTAALVESLNTYKPDLFITSGHATERDWMIGFRYKNGFFKSAAGTLHGEDTKKNKLAIDSANPKVYLPIGNCLMGHIDGPDAMALAWIHSAGVNQMMGYTVPTWYGYAGWGVLDYFVEQPGRYTLTQAFFANQHAMIHRLNENFPAIAARDTQPGTMLREKVEITPTAKANGLGQMDAAGLLHDRDVVAFYGDPAWSATMAPHTNAYDQKLTIKDNIHTLEITPNLGGKSFDPVNKNGAQRGHRPIVQFLPSRIHDIKLLEDADWSPIITDDFILIPNPGKVDAGRTLKIQFTATAIKAQ